MSSYSLTASAQTDLYIIRDYYLEEAGYRIARQMIVEFVAAFRTIARNPGIGHKRQDLAGNRPILFWPMRDYLILYRIAGASLVIIMIARGSRDIARLIRRREP
jgi:plasmid stabilization system protein ParE